MLKRYKLVWMGLLAIGYALVQLWVLFNFSDSVLSRLRRLEPLSAAAVRRLPVGSDVLVEGRISQTMPQRYSTLVAYVRSSELRYSEKEPGVWVEDDRVVPALLLETADGTVAVEPGYALEKTARQKQTKRANYNGFERGSEVFVVGTLSRAGTIKAETLYGGQRGAYLFSKTGEKWVGYGSLAFLILLGLVLIAVEVMLGRNRR
ncbi:hypothetical protein [Hymenobacter metallicola]|uniref:Uncharacterized protein n=1 Tax=Hymenobacter metallicola TaxID=2563114 RepID=A0A4Z0QJL8_9BACT|nr:hypothetical protein [Hymenobacter metallicola]TGE29895.1 hypothetical protein E5K02_10675 [Hymenobacter metallicola]